MTEQEQEERDYFPQNEWQNVFAQSMMEQEPDDTAKINELVAAGRFVVVMEHPTFCPHTDAFMRMQKSLQADCPTRDEADLFLIDNSYNDGECNWYVLPESPKPTPVYDPIDPSEIPF